MYLKKHGRSGYLWEHQKMLINEGQINLADRESRKWLNEQMELFLSGEDYAKPSGFVPKE